MQKTTFTLAEAATVLSCHKETLRRAIMDGELRAARLGREYRISRMDLQAFWIAQGGGDLFPPERGESQTDPSEEKEKNVSPQKPRYPAGPEQLTLPT